MPKVSITVHLFGAVDDIKLDSLMPQTALIEIWKLCLDKKTTFPEWIRGIVKQHNIPPNDPIALELTRMLIPETDLLWTLAALDGGAKNKDLTKKWLGLWIDIKKIEWGDGKSSAF